jgi:predicted RNA-binding Zn-ribbon protein involved in translation (DUF1610 family)
MFSVSLKSGSAFSVTLFGDSGCFLPLYVAPFSDEQIERIRRYQQHPDFIGVLCYTCIRKEKMLASYTGMVCPHCGATYEWAYGLLSREEADREATQRYNRPLCDFEESQPVKLRRWEPEE